MNWNVVYTRPCWEKKVSKLLDIKGIENYCPMQKKVRQWSDRKKIIYDPLFKSYVFVRIDQKQRNELFSTDGVLKLVQFEGRAAVLTEEEIIQIKTFVEAYKDISVQQIDFEIADTVRIKSGPFNDKTGKVIQIKKNTVKILLPTLGFTLVAEIEKQQLEKLATA
ncbi:MAG: UpxY family transcription antiterminator [Chitinophagaceae bacterium]|uniref:transcription termination/antitermination protein NusG n=1 Tax=unclassified Paraflavitalea TaxID=2798305 RepID=UPI003D32EA93|nr:UpxY family transcription antiterminator [Chitinophagaceae bacterium]